MLFRLISSIVVLSMAATLTGCAAWTPNYVRKIETAYLSSCEAPPLQIPAGLSAANIGDDYIIPPANGPRPTCPADVTPPCYHH